MNEKFLVECPKCRYKFELIEGINFSIMAEECDLCGIHTGAVIECPKCAHQQKYGYIPEVIEED